MKRSISSCVLLLAAAVLLPSAGASAQVTEPVYLATDATDGDPFCAVAVTAVSASPLVLQLHAAEGVSVAARILVFAADGAYVVDVPQLPLLGSGATKATAAFAIEAPKTVASRTPASQLDPSALSIKPRYVYVDAYRLDGGAQTDCPTEPVAFVADRPQTASSAQPVEAEQSVASLATFPASSVLPLPALPCGTERTKATVKNAFAPPGIDRTLDRASSSVLAYVDARGNLVKAVMYKSSGSKIDDEMSMIAAHRSTYSPATFYCTAVPGAYLFVSDFERL